MTSINNRKIDQLVAEHAFGRRPEWIPHHTTGEPEFLVDEEMFEIKHYSTSIAAAWAVVEKMREKMLYAYNFKVEQAAHTTFACTFDHRYDFPMHLWCNHESAPMAICLAALKALGVKYD